MSEATGRRHHRVIVIGGGVVGCSALYHLALQGWTDIALLELDELTSGSTWHAAGNVPTFSTSRNIIRLQHYSTELYTELAADPAHPISYHRTGSIRLAQGRERFEEFHHIASMAQSMGIEYEMLDAGGIEARHPFLETAGLTGALWDPHDGDIDPSQLTQALAHRARAFGATIHRFTRVTAITRTDTREWALQTDKGEYRAEIVVNAGGYRGAEIAAMAGQFLPIVSMEHQYLVTESIDALASLATTLPDACDGKLPLVRDPDDSYYLRQEKTGLILGPYERHAKAHWEDGRLPEQFAYQLFADDLERLEWHIDKAVARMPLLGTAGIQRVINGPIPYAPDGLPYIGPAFGLENFYHCCGFSFGICQAGGAGKSIAEWIVHGRPEWDLWSCDPRRYTAYADQAYVRDKAIELYQNEYAIAYPVKEWPAGRPRRVTPLYDTLKQRGAEFGARGGWERATWFPRDGDERDAPATFHRPAWFEAVGEECRHVQQHVGVIDIGGFATFELDGDGAADWLDTLTCSRLPRIGRAALAYFCCDSGGIWSEMTISRLDTDRFLLIGGAAALWHDWQWLTSHLPEAPTFTLTDRTDDTGTLVVAGPASRRVLQALTAISLDNASHPWLSAVETDVAGVPALLLRMNYVGELGWELHVPMSALAPVYAAIRQAGADHGIRDIGIYAVESMRLEKAYRGWKTELDHAASPLVSGLERFVAFDKPHFIGRDALLAERSAGVAETLVSLVLDDGDAEALFGCPIRHAGSVVGFTTSGGYGHRVGRSVALGYLRADLAVDDTVVSVDVLGKRRAAVVCTTAPYDAGNRRLRDDDPGE